MPLIVVAPVTYAVARVAVGPLVKTVGRILTKQIKKKTTVDELRKKLAEEASKNAFNQGIYEARKYSLGPPSEPEVPQMWLRDP